MEPQRQQMYSYELHEALGGGLELDLGIGTILAVDGAVGIKYASDERFWNHLWFRNKGFQFIQTERHSPRMKDEGDFLRVSVEIHGIFALPVSTREFEIENLEK